jgi:hypothetical protein
MPTVDWKIPFLLPHRDIKKISVNLSRKRAVFSEVYEATFLNSNRKIKAHVRAHNLRLR